jgi:hypothetical protein
MFGNQQFSQMHEEARNQRKPQHMFNAVNDEQNQFRQMQQMQQHQFSYATLVDDQKQLERMRMQQIQSTNVQQVEAAINAELQLQRVAQMRQAFLHHNTQHQAPQNVYSSLPDNRQAQGSATPNVGQHNSRSNGNHDLGAREYFGNYDYNHGYGRYPPGR